MTATLTLIGLLVLAALAGAQRPGGIGTPLLATPLISKLNEQAGKIRQARANRCLSPPVFRWDPGHLVPERARPQVINQRRERLRANRARDSQCIPWPWDALAECESGGRWDYNGSSGFDGGLQFLPSTWVTASQLIGVNSRYQFAWQAPAIVQVRVAQAWLAVTSWAQWPACSRELGLR